VLVGLQAFVGHYYSLFDTNRAALVGMFQPMSMMSFEGDKFQVPPRPLSLGVPWRAYRVPAIRTAAA
jgi:hypothetical protein